MKKYKTCKIKIIIYMNNYKQGIYYINPENTSENNIDNKYVKSTKNLGINTFLIC